MVSKMANTDFAVIYERGDVPSTFEICPQGYLDFLAPVDIGIGNGMSYIPLTTQISAPHILPSEYNFSLQTFSYPQNTNFFYYSPSTAVSITQKKNQVLTFLSLSKMLLCSVSVLSVL